MQKQIFQCTNCKYFPADIELQTYFLNSDTVNCPACDQLNSFDPNTSILLNKQFHIQHRPHHSSLITMQQSHKLSSQKRNDTIWICIEKGQWVLQHLYLNPLNPQLKNSLNIQKAQILEQRKMVFFCLNDQILRRLHSKTKFRQSSSQSLAKSTPFKYGLRKVSKIEHLFYCLDLYIQDINSTFFQKGNQEGLEIVIQIVQKKGPHENASNSVNSLDQSIATTLRFTMQSYKQFQSFYSMSFQDLNNQQECQKNQQFKKYIDQFLASIYTKEKTQNQSKNKRQYILQSQMVQLKVFVFFTNTFDLGRVNNLLQFKISQLNLNKAQDSLKNILVQSFYFQNDQIKNIKQATTSSDSIHKSQDTIHRSQDTIHRSQDTIHRSQDTIQRSQDMIRKSQLSDELSLLHSILYIPHSKQQTTIDYMINRVINSSKQEMRKSKKQQNRQPIKNEKQNSKQTRRSMTNFFQDEKIGLNKPQYNHNLIHQNSFEPCTYVYWKMKNPNQNNETAIKFNKIKMKSLTNLFIKFIQDLSEIQAEEQTQGYTSKFKETSKFNQTSKFKETSKFNQTSKFKETSKFNQTSKFKQSMIKEIQPQLINNLLTNEGDKPLLRDIQIDDMAIKIDRVYVELQENRIYFIFNYDQISKQDFQELDFLDEPYLPQQLKGYSTTYQKLQSKIENPFKKQIHRVSLVKPQDQHSYHYDLSDSDRQSL